MISDSNFVSTIERCVQVVVVILVIASAICVLPFAMLVGHVQSPQGKVAGKKTIVPPRWSAPDVSTIPSDAAGERIRYGRELVSHTAKYLGPQGVVMHISNGMNCQNCHLNAGTLYFGNNYSAVASTYPKFRARSGTIESIQKRVNDCIERSLNGTALDTSTKEMQAFVAYIKWVGQAVKKDSVPKGAGLMKLPFLNKAADPVMGRTLFEKFCVRCHGAHGEGMKGAGQPEWRYPPVAGVHSYNIGAGLYRISRFAGYIKANMPYGEATYDRPVLSDEEAWHIAAYVNSMDRPDKDLSNDWPDIASKPYDHPFGPYADAFPERQHKYGPFDHMKAK